MNWLSALRKFWKGEPKHLKRGRVGENAARGHLEKLGLKFLTANFSTRDGEIDLIFRDRDCLVFVEVKTSSSEEWGRPADRVDRKKEKRICATAQAYLKLLKEPRVKLRFDIVEVLLAGEGVREIRHLPVAFNWRGPSMYGEGRKEPPSRSYRP